MKKYFVYELKKNTFVILALTLVLMLGYAVPAILESANVASVYQSVAVNLLDHIQTGIVIAAIAVAVWMFRYKMSKRSLDLYYSLPISHTKILVVKFLIGLLALLIAYTAAYWVGAITVTATCAVNKLPFMHGAYYIPLYFASLIPFCLIYSISSFCFTRANTTCDGVVFIAFGLFAMWLFAEFFNELTAYSKPIILTDGTTTFKTQYLINSYFFAPWHPIHFATEHFRYKIFDYSAYIHQEFPDANITQSGMSVQTTVSMSISYSLLFLMGAGAAVGLILTERNAKAENVGQISESPFGYKVMAPAYTALLIALCTTVDPTIDIFIAVAAFVLTLLYRRTIKIGWKQATIFILSLAAGFVLYGFICI